MEKVRLPLAESESGFEVAALESMIRPRQP
jgi:hypothetical protein